MSVLVALATAGAAAATTPDARDLFPTAAALRSKIADDDFAIDISAIKGKPNGAGNVRPGEQGDFPVLGLPDVQMAFSRFTIEPNAHNALHTHPRATETLFVIKGRLEVFFVEENSATSPARLVENTLRPEGLTVFPRGLIHGQRCVSDDTCEYLSVLNSGDPGVITVGTRLCDAPVEAVAAALGAPERVAKRVCHGAANSPAVGQPSKPRHWAPRRRAATEAAALGSGADPRPCRDASPSRAG